MQSVRGTTVSESSSRASLYMTILSSALIAYGFLADTNVATADLGVVLPIVFLLALLPGNVWCGRRWRTSSRSAPSSRSVGTQRAASWCEGIEKMVTDNTAQLSGLFGVYLQVGDLHRSLSFYCDVLALEVVWNDGALAVLHTHRAPADSLVIREIGNAARHNMGEAGVTRVLWRVGDPAELDSAEELLTRQQVPYQRHRDVEVDGITMHDPDGLEIVLLWIGEKVPATGPPAWLHWYH